ncbi:DUF4159 domain-containing protein [bacterium]|nr:DUF4159 domain-containing protein [bacterium]
MDDGNNDPRLSRVSGIIDFGRLERENRRYLHIGFIIAVVFHALLLAVFPYRRIAVKTEEKPRIVTLRLIERRNTEPFMLRKQPLHHRSYERKTNEIHPSASAPGSAPHRFSPVIPESHPAEVHVGHESDTVALPGGIDIDLGISRAPDDRIPIKNRLFDDPGMYRADIIYNPDNKMATQGYVHIPVIQFENFKPTESMRLSIRGLANAINRMTNITAVVDNPLPTPVIVTGSFDHPVARPIKENSVRGLTVDSLFVNRPPLVYILADRRIRISEAEKGSFRHFIGTGGILFLESARPGDEALRMILRSFLQELTSSARAIERIPDNHPVYHCFFDFDHGAPEGASQEYGAVPDKTKPYLEGIWFGDRLIAIFSDRGYGLMWGAESRNREQLMMGVNLVVFGLIQQKGYGRGEWYAYRNQ